MFNQVLIARHDGSGQAVEERGCDLGPSHAVSCVAGGTGEEWDGGGRAGAGVAAVEELSTQGLHKHGNEPGCRCVARSGATSTGMENDQLPP